MDDNTPKYIRLGVKVSAFLGYFPYGWSEATGMLTFSNGPWRRLYFYAQICLYWSYLTVMSMRALYVTYVNSEGKTISSRTNLQYVVVGHLGPVPFQLRILYFYDSHHVVMNRYLLFRKQLREEWNVMRSSDRCKSIRAFCHRVMVLAGMSIVSNVMPTRKNPRAVHLITSMIPGAERWPKLMLFPFAIVQFLLTAHVYSDVYVFLSFMVAYAADVSRKLELMR